MKILSNCLVTIRKKKIRRMKLESILKEALDANKITKLSVFDFDGTLVDTTLPEDGKPMWKAKTGEDWPHVGWWSKPESLSMDIFPNPTLPSVVSAYKAERANDNTLVIMLTGRRNKPELMAGVKKILDSHGLDFDMYLYNYGGETSANKMEQMEKIIANFPNIKQIEAWDDRDEHIPKFKAWGETIEPEFHINHVLGEHHGVKP